MANTIPATLVLTLACLFALSNAFPRLLNQITPVQTELNAPHTLLGKPYRRRSDLQDLPPQCFTQTVTDRSDSGGDPNTLPGPDHASTHQARGEGGTRTKINREPRVQLPLPLVLDMSSVSVPARLRLVKLKRAVRHNPCPDDVFPSSQALSNGMTTRVEDAQHVQDISRSEGEAESRNASVRVGRSKRLYDRGEWKSRLFVEY